jgi:hypothetical protein
MPGMREIPKIGWRNVAIGLVIAILLLCMLGFFLVAHL